MATEAGTSGPAEPTTGAWPASPQGAATRGPSGRQLARRVVAYLRPYRARLVGAALLAVVETLLLLVPIYVFKVVVDRLSGTDPSLGGVVLPMVIAFAGAVSGAALGVASTYLVQRAGEGVVFDLRQQLFGRYVQQSTGYYSRTRGGAPLSRILNDVGAIDTLLATSLLNIVRNALGGVSIVVVMFVLEWHLALLLLVLTPLVILPVRRAGARIALARRRVQEQLSDVTTYLQETLGLSGMQLVRAFGRQETERARFTTMNAELRQREVRAAMAARWFTASLTILTSIGPAIIILVGGWLVVEDVTTLGTVLVFATLIAGRLGSTIQGFATTATALLGAVPVWQRVFEALDEEPDVRERDGAVALPREAIRGDVAMTDVTYTYPGQERPAVEGVELDVAAGSMVGIVGPSGAGKTTLGGLLLRQMDPDRGTVRIDGHDVAGMTTETLSRAVGVVFQDTFLFHASVAENLRYGRPDATDEELRRAVRAADLDGVVDALPDGLGTIVGERGHRLSGGEKQRLAIARVLVEDAPVVVLDEATSHLDGVAEQRVQAALEGLLADRTSIVVAHRLATVQRADLILVMDGGRVVERGTHEELQDLGGLYARLLESQRLDVA